MLDPAAARSRGLVRTLLGGRIIFNNNASVFDCTVRHMSKSGAVLQLGSTLSVPRVFILETKPFKQRYPCIVTRRTPSSIEVAFAADDFADAATSATV